MCETTPAHRRATGRRFEQVPYQGHGLTCGHERSCTGPCCTTDQVLHVAIFQGVWSTGHRETDLSPYPLQTVQARDGAYSFRSGYRDTTPMAAAFARASTAPTACGPASEHRYTPL